MRRGCEGEGEAEEEVGDDEGVAEERSLEEKSVDLEEMEEVGGPLEERNGLLGHDFVFGTTWEWHSTAANISLKLTVMQKMIVN